MLIRAKDWGSVEKALILDNAEKFDHRQSVSRTGMVGGLISRFGGEAGSQAAKWSYLQPLPSALSQLLSLIGIPADYYAKVVAQEADEPTRTGVSDALVNMALRAYSRQKSSAPELLFRMRERHIRAVLSGGYVPVDNAQVVETLHDALKGISHEIRYLELSEESLRVKITFNDLEFTDPVGGKGGLRPGFMLGNSETGRFPVSMSPFLFRCLCTNDLVVVAVSRKHIHVTIDEIRLLVMRSVNAAMLRGKETAKRFVELRDLKVRNPKALLYRLAKQAGQNKEFYARLWGAYQEEPERNRYGVVNAFTRAAQQVRDHEQRVDVESFAGSLLDFKDDKWTALDRILQPQSDLFAEVK